MGETAGTFSRRVSLPSLNSHETTCNSRGESRFARVEQRESMACQPRTRLRFLVLLLPWPQAHLLGVRACEQCEIDAAESQASVLSSCG